MQNLFSSTRIRCLCLVLMVAGTVVFAEETPVANDVEKQNIEAALKVTRESAAKYEMLIAGDSKPLTLRPQPILRWSNPEVGQIYGNVFVWTRGGRPEVVGSLFKWFSPFTHMSHEFHSLSRGELTVEHRGKPVWHCDVMPFKDVGNHKLPYTSFRFNQP